MVEMELYLNTMQIKKAVFCVGKEYREWRLKELLDRTALQELIVTGYISEEQGQKMVQALKEQAEFGHQRVPAKFTFCDLKQLDKQRWEEDTALLFEGLTECRDILPFTAFSPRYLLGNMKEEDCSSFTIWDAFRKCCEHIQIVTMRTYGEPQVLDWQKRQETDIELSIIFPMYNVSEYLDQCIRSVTAWKAPYVEFLFINDGSPDNSRDIVLRWAQQDERIILLDKPNGGCASARQWGLERAKGRYVGFVDPDDFADESMFRKLLRNAFLGGYDISYCGYKEYYQSNGETKVPADVLGWPYNMGTSDANSILNLIVYSPVAIWRGIYKMEMLQKNNIHFYTELRRFDDLPFKVETFAAARSVISLEEHLYNYRLARPGQDVSADDERLYVHFPIFSHLNETVAGRKEQYLTDCLQLCKIQTHRYALGKIKPEFLKEYMRQAREDLIATGGLLRTFFMAKQRLGKKSALIYWAIMRKQVSILKSLIK